MNELTPDQEQLVTNIVKGIKTLHPIGLKDKYDALVKTHDELLAYLKSLEVSGL